MSAQDTGDQVTRLEITGSLDRHAAEALQLEVRRLARRYGVEVRSVRIEREEIDDR